MNIRKTSVIAPLGTSPPVITEFLQYVEEVLNQRVSDVTVIVTKDPLVLEGVELIKVAVKRRYPHTHLHMVKLPFTDIGSEEDSLKFMSICARILREQRNVHHVNLVYLCVAGGRKDMCIILSLLSQYFAINGVYHLIMPDVQTFNIQLERLRHEISELARAKNKEEYYEKYEEYFNELMYPSLNLYTTVKIPLLPYPTSVLKSIGRVLGSKVTSRRRSGLPEDVLERLEMMGLIKTTREKIYVTSEGREFHRVFTG